MIIEKQRNRVCPDNYNIIIGHLVCEECDSWRFKVSDRVNKHGVKLADEWCEKFVVCDKQ